MRSASDPTCPRSRNSLDKALASTNYTSPFYSKESADSCYRHIYLASYEALPTLPVGIWEKCLCKLNPTCIPNAISKVSPMHTWWSSKQTAIVSHTVRYTMPTSWARGTGLSSVFVCFEAFYMEMHPLSVIKWNKKTWVLNYKIAKGGRL